MAATGITDRFSNVLYDKVVESSANTLTFEEVNVGLNIFDKVGLLVSRIEYTGMETYLSADPDHVEFGLSASNGWASADPAESSVIDYNRWKIVDFGTAGNAIERHTPFIKDFSNLPGGGILITPKPLYMYIQGSSLTSPGSVAMRMFFTVLKLKPEDYFELLESRQYFG
jgi:hypothetical protein